MILRSVRGIDKSDSKARSYLDLSPEGNADKEASSFIDWIHNTGVQQYLGSDKGVFKATVNWHSSGMPVYLLVSFLRVIGLFCHMVGLF